MSTKQIKIVFTGSVGAGKTLAIKQLSEIEVINTEVNHTQATNQEKRTTTVGMDYGQLNLSPTEKLHLYGTPGQRRFDFMSDVLTKGALALVIVINNEVDDPLLDLSYYLNLNKTFLKQNTAIIAISHMDISKKINILDYEKHLIDKGISYPVMSVDLRDQNQAFNLLELIVNHLEDFHFS